MTLAHFGPPLYRLQVVYTGTSHVSTSLISKLGRSLGMSLGMSLGIIHLYDLVQWLITKHNGMLIEQNS